MKVKDNKDVQWFDEFGNRITTSEVLMHNDNYGLAKALKMYADFPESSYLSAYMPHGFQDKNTIDVLELPNTKDLPFSNVLSWQPTKDDAYREVGHNVVSIASPFYYVKSMTDDNTEPAEREGTVFFPVHTTEGHNVVYDYIELEKKLDALPDYMKPITICAYYRDLMKTETYDIFKEKGYAVVTMGPLFQDDFLFRLYNTLRHHKYAGSNWAGTNLLYSIIADTPYFILGEDDVSEKPYNEEGITDRLNRLFSYKSFNGEITDEQREVVRALTNYKHIESPVQLFNKLNGLPE